MRAGGAVVEESGSNLTGISDQNLSLFWNQESVIWVQKNGISDEKTYLVTTVVLQVEA